MTAFKDRLREIRERKGWTQKQLAERVQIADSAISHYETAKREPLGTNLKRLALGLDVSADYLLGIDEHSRVDEALVRRIEALETPDRLIVTDLVDRLAKGK